MNTEQQLEQVELSIEQAKVHINLMKQLERLTVNEDFINIMLKGYFEEEASRLVLLKAEPQMQEEAHQNHIIRSIDAIGTTRQYFNTIMQVGRAAERALVADEQTREELLAEAV